MMYPRKRLDTGKPSHDIFRAALDDDLAELAAARGEGQRLTDADPMTLMTPLHIAASRHSNQFIAEALKDDSCDPFQRDANDRTAWDHALAHNNIEGCELLRIAMSAHLYERDDRHIVYLDHPLVFD